MIVAAGYAKGRAERGSAVHRAAAIGAVLLAGALAGCSSSASGARDAGTQDASGLPPGGGSSTQGAGTTKAGPVAGGRTVQVAALGARSVKVVDRYPDAATQGAAPAYGDITWAAVEDLGQDLRLVIASHGDLPQKMPDGMTYMIVSWNLDGDRTHPGRGFSVQASPKGWSIQVGGNEGTVPYPGTFAVDGKTIEIKFPWTFLGGRHGFAWSASSSWFAYGGKKPSASTDTTAGKFTLMGTR